MLLQFQKGDIVRHLGLLDLQRTMQRAARKQTADRVFQRL